MNTSSLEQNLLPFILQEATFDGWTFAALERAIIAAGYPKEYAEIAFPQGISDAVDYYIHHIDSAMIEALSQMPLASLKIRERIHAGVITRLTLYEPHKEAVRSLMSYFSLPHHAPQALRHLAHTTDLIWKAAGDNATDYNWYTKRMMLAGVMTSTLLYWLNDTSDSYADTYEFLNRRIDNIMHIQKLKGKITQFTHHPLPKIFSSHHS